MDDSLTVVLIDLWPITSTGLMLLVVYAGCRLLSRWVR